MAIEIALKSLHQDSEALLHEPTRVRKVGGLKGLAQILKAHFHGISMTEARTNRILEVTLPPEGSQTKPTIVHIEEDWGWRPEIPPRIDIRIGHRRISRGMFGADEDHVVVPSHESYIGVEADGTGSLRHLGLGGGSIDEWQTPTLEQVSYYQRVVTQVRERFAPTAI